MSKASRKKKLEERENKAKSTAPTYSRPTTQADLLYGTRRKPRRWNVRFLVLLGLWIAALIIGLLFITGKF